MIEFDDARRLLADAVTPLPPEDYPLAEAVGLRIAEPPVADVDMPPGDVSAMDGYAARAADLEAETALPVAFELPAGSPPRDLPDGAAARIFTGALLPGGADTVVPQEQAQVGDNGRVRLEVLAEGSHVRRGGEVFGAGSPLAAIGDVVTPQRAMLMASGGASRPRVVPRPRVGVVLTGSEIVDVDDLPGPGQIRNSNGPTLAALAAMSGLEPPRQWIAADDEEVLGSAISAALDEHHLVLTCGGVSVGDYDLVPQVVRALGGEQLFHRVRMKPGKPLLAARIGERWLLGLPGNPLAVLIGWRLFGWPLLRALAGDRRAFAEQPVRARLLNAIRVGGGRTVFRPARLEAARRGPEAEVLSWRGSHDVATAASADAVARFEPGQNQPAGAEVACYPLHGSTVAPPFVFGPAM